MRQKTRHGAQSHQQLTSGWFFVILSASLLGGCATTGPRVSSQEIQEATDELKVKGLLTMAEQQQRVWQIGSTLIEALPAEQKRGPYPEIGVAVDQIDRVARKAFQFPERQQGIYVLAARDGGPAALAGIRRGDIVLALNGRRCHGPGQFIAMAGKLSPGSACALRIKRAEQELDVPVTVGSRSLKVSFAVSRSQEVNASAKPHKITVTTGLTRFVESDDELAVVLGHELAHITERHQAKALGISALASVVGATLGAATDIVAPGVGSMVTGSVAGVTEAAFSRGFEREADYRGLLHTYRGGYDVEAGVAVWERFSNELPGVMLGSLRSTHPASPERMIRIRKIAKSLKDIGLEQTIAKYEDPQPVGSR